MLDPELNLREAKRLKYIEKVNARLRRLAALRVVPVGSACGPAPKSGLEQDQSPAFQPVQHRPELRHPLLYEVPREGSESGANEDSERDVDPPVPERRADRHKRLLKGKAI
jgi:hypothetical protein